jgi:hypothetical protein
METAITHNNSLYNWFESTHHSGRSWKQSTFNNGRSRESIKKPSWLSPEPRCREERRAKTRLNREEQYKLYYWNVCLGGALDYPVFELYRK